MVFVKYTPEIKAVVIKLVLRGLQVDEINNLIDTNVNSKTVQRWHALYSLTRNVLRDPALYKQQGRPLAISSEEGQFVLDVLAIDPTMYLDEIQSHLEIMTRTIYPTMTIHNTLNCRLNLTLKVACTVHPAQCPMKLATYIASVAPWPSKYLVFVDECVVSQDSHCRTKGWATKRHQTSHIHPEHNAKQISVLPAVSLEGLLCVIAQEGSITQLDFKYFLEEVLMECMNPFPGPNSIVVMDNEKVHHEGRVAEICAAHQVLLTYLPPYLPDYNPIKKVFSVLKSKLKQAQVLTGNNVNTQIIKDFLPGVVTPQLMRALFDSSGYA